MKLFESVACSRGEFVYDKAGYRSAGKCNCQLRVFVLPALNTIRKLPGTLLKLASVVGSNKRELK